MLKSVQSIVFVASTLATTLTFAQKDSTKIEQATNKDLDEVIVTASKYAQKQAQTGKVVTVIGPEVIAKSAGKSVVELLNQQAGITIIGSQNAYGTNADVYVRGAASGYTLILLNGTPIYDPSSSSNSFDLNLITMEQIERIEILKGGQSTLYGSDAMAGVINIITKKSTSQFQGNVNLSGGSYDTYKASVGLVGQIAKTNYALQVGHLTSKGFSTAKDKVGNKNFDRDGFTTDNINLTADNQATKKLNINGIFSYNKNKVDLDNGSFKDALNYFTNNENLLWGLGSTFELTKGKLHLNYSNNVTKRYYQQDMSVVSADFVRGHYQGNSSFLELYGNFSLNTKLDLIAGVENRSQSMSSDYLSGGEGWSYTATPIESSKTNTNLFSTYASLNLKNSGIFGAELGGRINSHSVYGSNSTFTINPYILLKNSAKFFVNYSSSFKVPSQYQLYSEYGNADLKPTTAATFEIGTQLFTKDKKANVRAVYFDRSTKDIIIYQSLNVAPWGKYVNFDKQHDYGVEIEGKATIELLTVTANYTFVEGSVTTVVAGKDETYQNLFRRPKNSFNLSLGYNVTPKWNIQHTIHSVSQAASGPYDDKTVTLGNYTTIDLYQEYQISSVLKAFLDIKNLTDTEYYDIPGYNSRRFNFMAGLQAKF